MTRIVLCISFWTLFLNNGLTQTEEFSNKRSITIALDSLPVVLDSLTVLPESVEITDDQGLVIKKSDYVLIKNELFWASSNKPAFIKINFRVLPYDLHKSYTHLDTSKIEIENNEEYIGFIFSPYEPQDGLIDFQGLDYNGSFARGFSFGNNQNLVLNSSFNLQLAGNLGDDVEILAAISDNNIPLQPEGNTQQLQEFDKIFIQLKKGNSSLTAGDYELGRPNSYFMNYFKKLKGATVENTWEINDKSSFQTKASVAIARGKFSRNTILAQEGNQGPYRLEGTDGERFIIVLAGTEKVFLDGELLKRGLEEDYIIDYNRADVLFTNKRLITKDSRIIVEFEYAVQSYTRSLYAVNTEYKTEKARLYMNVYSEQDSKNSGGATDLDSLQKSILIGAGDNPEGLIDTSIDTLEEFNQFRVSYKSIDTIYLNAGIPDTSVIYVYSTNPDSAFLSVNFLEVPQGDGDYIIDNSTAANGRVYRWLAPDPLTGIRQGNYTPGRNLIPPNKRSLYTFGGEFQLSKNSSLLTEVAISNNDLNRFSSIDSGDDTGLAVFSQFKNTKALGKKDTWVLDTRIGYEFVQKNFKALNPYRNAEFTRDWNINNLGIEKAMEQIGKGGFVLTKKNLGSLSYEFSGFLRNDLYTGTKHFARLNFKKNGFAFDFQGSFLNTDATSERSAFFRPKLDVSKTFKKIKKLENRSVWRTGKK